MNKLLHTSSSPHVCDQTDTTRIMIDVIIALMPATLYGIYQFKLNAALIVVVSVLTCVLSEYLFEYFMKKPITIKDCSAIVTGLILALNLPSTVPLWIPVIGALFAIIIVKQLYGGLGQNFMNPALALLQRHSQFLKRDLIMTCSVYLSVQQQGLLVKHPL